MKNRETVESRAQDYLEKKYNQRFKVVDSIPAGMDVPYDEISLQTDLYLGKTVKVYCRENGGNVSFQDNYFGILKEAEYAQLLRQTVGQVFSNHKVYFVFMSDFFEDAYTDTTELRTVMAEDKSELRANIRVFVLQKDISQQSFEEKSKELFVKLKEGNFYGMVSVYLVEENAFSGLEEENYAAFLKENLRMIPSMTEVVK